MSEVSLIIPPHVSFITNHRKVSGRYIAFKVHCYPIVDQLTQSSVGSIATFKMHYAMDDNKITVRLNVRKTFNDGRIM
jgi:hypothetical protein